MITKSRRKHITIPGNIAHNRDSQTQTKGNTCNNYGKHKMRLHSYNQNRRQTLKRLIEISRPVIETAGTLAKNQPSTRESKRSSGQHNNIGPNIPEPSVHGTKLEPKRLAKNSKYRRDNHPKLKPPPQANLHRKAYTLNFIILLHRSHQRTRES